MPQMRQRDILFTSNPNVLWVGLSLGVIYWFLESWIHVFFFSQGHLLDEIVAPDVHEIWKRALVIGLLIIFSVFFQYSITMRRRAEAALHERERELTSILENNPAGIMLVDAESGRIGWANTNALKMTGFSETALLGQPCHRCVCPNERDNCPVLNPGQIVEQSEQTLLTADGGLLPILKSVARVRYNGREHLLETFFDLSERKRMETDLKLAHAELDQIFQTASVGMRVIDRDFNVLKVNQTLARMTRVPISDAVGRKCYDVFAGSKCGTDGCPLKRILGGQARVDGHVLKHRPDGTRIPCILTATPFVGPEGQIAGIVESFRDISALKNAQEAIELERDKLERILTHLSEGVYIINRDFIVEYENTALKAQIGFGVGQCCYTVFRQQTAPCEPCLMKLTLASGQVLQHEFETPDGRSFEQTYTPITDVDEERKVVALLRDVTHKKESLAAIMRAEQLAALGELAAGVAHEINNPINGIINYAQIVVNKREGGDLVKDICGRIIREGNRIARIVEGLLSFAQSKKTERTRFDVGEILSDALSLTGVQMRRNRVTLKTAIAAGLPKILGHPNEIEQVFINIIINAIHALNLKHPASDGANLLKITANRFDVKGRPGVRIAFYDTGVGIPADLIDKVRNPFFSTKTDGKCTGLGLSISHGIVKDHDGQLKIESIAGEYTCVSVDLPTEQEFDT